jgi:hypothetical protein
MHDDSELVTKQLLRKNLQLQSKCFFCLKTHTVYSKGPVTEYNIFRIQ